VPNVILDNTVLWLAQTNCWVLAREPGGPAIVVDAPPDPAGVIGLLAGHDLHPTALLLTHGHIDHVGGAEAVREATASAVYVHPDDDFLTLDPVGQWRALVGMAPPGELHPLRERIDLADGMIIESAGFSVEVRHTPGHTPGHCCFFLDSEGILFSGDQLFARSIGRTDLPGGSFESLMTSMRDKILVLDDEVRVLPGHGPETTIGIERRLNPFLAG
jgi:hydroxyacylglutathione hydrolase